MRAASGMGLGLLVWLVGMPACGAADRSGLDGLRSSVMEVLSLTTFGTVTVQDQAAEVTRNGADFILRLPLRGLSAPAGATVDTIAHPLNGGVWDITSMTFPAAGTVEPVAHDGGDSRITYAIGEQNIRAKIDPGFMHPSSFAGKLGDVRLRFDQGVHHTEQMFDHYSVDGALSGEIAGRLTFASNSKAENLHLISHGPDGADIDSSVGSLAGHLTVEGLDRIQANRWLTATRALLAGAQPAAPSATLGLSAAQREALRGMIDAADGLLTRFEADQTFDSIRFVTGSGISGTVGRMHFNMRGMATDEHLTANMDIALDAFALAGLSAETAAYVPHDVEMKSVLAGIRAGKLMAFLRAMTTPDADIVALQAQLVQLFNEPGARFGIESVTFDSGPMRMTGSARAVPRADGYVSAGVHLSATGVDALIAQAQSSPALQQALPVMFMAKGMGRVEGDAVVWDISFGDGPITVNGVPFGQPVARTR